MIGIAGGAPKKREFQGTTIYDFEIPEVPNNPNLGNARQFKGPISVAVAKNSVFVSSEPTLLELVLRGGGPALADSPDFKAVAKEIPEKASTLSYVRPEEQARLSYDMIEERSVREGPAGVGRGGWPGLTRQHRQDHRQGQLPDFSIFAKYLSQGGKLRPARRRRLHRDRIHLLRRRRPGHAFAGRFPRSLALRTDPGRHADLVQRAAFRLLLSKRGKNASQGVSTDFFGRVISSAYTSQ